MFSPVSIDNWLNVRSRDECRHGERNVALRLATNPAHRCLIALLAVTFLAAPSAAQSRRTVMISNTTRTVGGVSWKFLQVGRPVINADGQIAFTAQALRGTATTELGSIWYEDENGVLKLVAFDGNAAPGTTTGITYANLAYSNPSLNVAGQIAYRGSLANTGATNNDSAFWVTNTSQASPRITIREGNTAPGTNIPPSTALAIFDEQIYDATPPPPSVSVPTFPLPIETFNAEGNSANVTRFRIGTGGASDKNDASIWFTDWDANSISMFARENSTVPGNVNITPKPVYGEYTVSPRLNDDDDMIYYSPLRAVANGSDGGGGIWLKRAGNNPTVIAYSGATAPTSSGAVFSSFQEPTLNDGANDGASAPEYAFSAGLAFSTNPNVNPTNDNGIWAVRRSPSNPNSLRALELILREGAHAPGLASSVGFGNLPAVAGLPTFDGLNINSEGRIAFRSRLTNLSSNTVTTLNDESLWIRELGTLNDVETKTRLIAREGDVAPQVTDGARFGLLNDPSLLTESAFSAPSINSLGQVAWLAHLTGAGVTTANDTGIWVKNNTGQTLLVAREGFALDVNDGPAVDNRTVLSLFMWTDAGGKDGRRSGLNSPATDSLSRLIFGASFTDNTTGVFVYTLPPLPIAGDYNGNGIVDAADYAVWRNSFGQMGPALPADGDGDGKVDNADYTLWKSHFGETSAGSGAGSIDPMAPVPEPHVAVLVSAALAAVTCLRRGRC